MARKATARKTSSRSKQKRASSRSTAVRGKTKTARPITGRSARGKSANKTRRPGSIRGGSTRGSSDAIALLKSDHDKVKKLFGKFEKQHGKMKVGDKAALVEQICHELEVHTRLEEEIFYPRIRAEVNGTEALLDEAKVEHQSAKDLISALESGAPDEGIYDAQVTVLGEYVKHHVKEEEDQLFPKVKRNKRVDLAELGEELAQRKKQLQ